MMITKMDISITYYHKEYLDLTPSQQKEVDDKYTAHLKLRDMMRFKEEHGGVVILNDA